MLDPLNRSVDAKRNNGNLGRQTITPGGASPIEQDYQYDPLNRLKLATEYYTPASASAPLAPSNLAAAAVSSSQINLTWTDGSTNEDGFKIERKTGSAGTWSQIATVGAGVASYQNTGLSASTTYYYRVRAYNASGDSNYSNEASATTQSGTGGTAPAPPSGLNATTASSSQINLTWTDGSTNEDGFKIERKTGSAGTWSQIATVGAGVASYQNTGLSASTTYYYRVRAYNASGDSNYSNEDSDTTTGGTSTDYAVKFNDTGVTNTTGYIRVPGSTAVTPTGAFTVEAWVKLTSNTVKQVIVSNRNTNTAGYELRVNASGQAAFAVYNATGGTNVQSGGTVPTGSWVHLSGTYTGTQLYVSVNGTVTGPVSTGAIVTSSTPLQIGRSFVSTTSADFLQGRIDELRISGGALYTSTFTPLPTLPVVSGQTKALWHMDENSNVYINDVVVGTTTTQGTLNGSATWTYGRTNPLSKRKRKRRPQAPLSGELPGGEQAGSEAEVGAAEAGTTKAGVAELASTGAWTQEFLYDEYGNRRWGPQTSNSAKGPDVTYATTNRLATIGGRTPVYDTAGNMTQEPVGTTAVQDYSYDAENRMWKAVAGGVTTTYVYDGNGRRVKKDKGGVVTYFVYDMAGRLIAEYPGTAPTVASKEYVYGVSGLLATVESGALQYVTPDHLGSPRVVTNGSGGVVSRHDYRPFGEELVAGESGRTGTGSGGMMYGGADNLRQKFTSYERDTETGLDFAQARYYGSTIGRFTASDPYNIVMERQLNKDSKEGDKELTRYISVPQQWNRYQYALNNPLLYTDPNGENVTIFYRKPNGDATDFGHMFIYVRNDETGDSAYFDYYAEGGYTHLGEVDQQRADQHASLTVETTAQQEQAILTGILSAQNGIANYDVSPPSMSHCTTQSIDLLKLGGINLDTANKLPSQAWSSAYAQFGESTHAQTAKTPGSGVPGTRGYVPGSSRSVYPSSPGSEYGRGRRMEDRHKVDPSAINNRDLRFRDGVKVN